jgi:hypothetical protein
MDEIDHHALKHVSVARGGRKPVDDVKREVDIGSLRLTGQAVNGVSEDEGEVERTSGQGDVAGLETRKLEKLFDHLDQAVNFGVGPGEEFSGRFRIVLGAALQSVYHGLDRREGRAELMETLAIKSRRTCSTRLTSERSWNTARDAQSPPLRIGVVTACRYCLLGRSMTTERLRRSSLLALRAFTSRSSGMNHANGLPTSSRFWGAKRRRAASLAKVMRLSASTATMASMLLLRAAIRRLWAWRRPRQTPALISP